MIEGVENAYPNYGIPQQKKFPMPDKNHVLSAIKFFNYVEPKYEKQLAAAIMRKIDEYGMDDVNVGPDNRFLKYWMKQGNELQHHGILGMKWGVRRYQNEDGTLTAAGKERYGVNVAPKANTDTSARFDVNYYVKSKAQDNSRILDKISKEKKKSKRREHLEQRYREQGFSAEEASIAAYKREKTERVLAAVGIVTATAVAVYAGKKWCENNLDTMIGEGTTLQRIDRFGDNGVKDAFYAAYGHHDKSRYEGFLGMVPGAKKIEMTVNSGGIKVASPKTFRDTLADVLGRDEGSKKTLLKNIADVERSGQLGGQWPNIFRKAREDLAAGKITNSVAEVENYFLVDHSPEMQKIHDGLFKTLKDRGYGAVIDINDRKYSGYNSRNPVVVFTKNFSNVKISDLDESSKIRKNAIEWVKKGFEDQAPVNGVLGLGSAGAIGIGGAQSIRRNETTSVRDARLVNAYKKEHPNTNMSNADILKAQLVRYGYSS